MFISLPPWIYFCFCNTQNKCFDLILVWFRSLDLLTLVINFLILFVIFPELYYRQIAKFPINEFVFFLMLTEAPRG